MRELVHGEELVLAAAHVGRASAVGTGKKESVRILGNHMCGEGIFRFERLSVLSVSHRNPPSNVLSICL